LLTNGLRASVARWFLLRPKTPNRVSAEGPWNGKCWYIFRPFWYNEWPFDIVCAVWCSLWSFGIFLRFGMFGPRNMGTLLRAKGLPTTLTKITQRIVDLYISLIFCGQWDAFEVRSLRIYPLKFKITVPDVAVCTLHILSMSRGL
jgi:hypothetical protein